MASQLGLTSGRSGENSLTRPRSSVWPPGHLERSLTLVGQILALDRHWPGVSQIFWIPLCIRESQIAPWKHAPSTRHCGRSLVPKLVEISSHILYIVHDVTQTSRPIDSYCGLLVHVCVRPALTCEWQSGRETRFSDSARFNSTNRRRLPELTYSDIWLWMLALKSEYTSYDLSKNKCYV
jgi:hypothetical protein